MGAVVSNMAKLLALRILILILFKLGYVYASSRMMFFCPRQWTPAAADGDTGPEH